MTISVIITGAGTGSRFSTDNNKLFYDLDGHPIIYHTVSAFVSHPAIAHVVITTVQETQQAFKDCLQDFSDEITYCLGGKTRRDSVYNGFQHVSQSDYVMVHDGARPIVSHDLINRLLKAAETHDAVIPVIPCTDTIKEVSGNTVTKTLDRDKLVRVQTPQVFKYTTLKHAYDTVTDSTVTDEAMLLEAAGFSVHTVLGDPCNIKLTIQSDITLLETFFQRT